MTILVSLVSLHHGIPLQVVLLELARIMLISWREWKIYFANVVEISKHRTHNRQCITTEERTMIINLTQHPASPEQIAAGVVDPGGG